MMKDPVAQDFGWRSRDVTRSQRFLYDRLFQVVISLDANRVLDLGCGNGYLCGRLSQEGIRAVGVDSDRKGIEIASNAYPQARFIHAPLSEALHTLCPYAFDIVLCSEVVEHLFNPSLVPKIASGVLEDGGSLIISTPYHGYFKSLALSLMNAWDKHHNPLREGGHIKFWSKATLTALLKNNGFEVVNFEGAGRFPYLWKSMIVVAKKHLHEQEL